MDIMERCLKCGIVPVVVFENAEDAVPCAKALLAGGIDVIEVTMRTPAAAEAIRRITAEIPEILVGAGTVLNLEQCKEIVDAGAKFVVSPGYDPDTVDYCLANGVAVLPGAVTPTEIMACMAKGIRLVKFFPANVYGGIKAMKSLAAPFVGIKFLPTGGVNADNLAEYIDTACIAAVGGSWVCTKKDISEHNFEKITALSAEARKIIDRVRMK